MSTITANRERTKWIGWLRVIKQDVQRLVFAKHMFSETQAMVRENPALHQPSSFYEYLAETYVSHAVACLRRQVKDSNDSISLARLLRELSNSPHFLTRNYYTGLYEGSSVEALADDDFDRYAGAGLGHVDGAQVAADLLHLRSATKKCETFADRRIAHWDRREPESLPTFAELDGCISLLDQLYVKYHGLFHAESMDTLLPTWQYDWQAIFRVPWIPPDTGSAA
jgi:hypothetical protein